MLQTFGEGQSRALPVFLAACGAGVLLGALYQILLKVVAIVQINWLLACLFGFGVGLLALAAAAFGHCRSRIISVLMALLIAGSALLASYYTGYGIALWKIKQKTPYLSYATLHKGLPFGQWLAMRREAGFSFKDYSGGAGPPFGATLIWVVEAMLVVGIPGFLLYRLRHTPYCEPCRRWTTEREAALPCANSQTAADLLQSGGVDAILNMRGDSNPTGTRWLVLVVHLCPVCRVSALLSLVWRRDKHPQEIEGSARQVLANNIILTKRQRDLLLTRLNGWGDPLWMRS